jgi:hypothetical protein
MVYIYTHFQRNPNRETHLTPFTLIVEKHKLKRKRRQEANSQTFAPLTAFILPSRSGLPRVRKASTQYFEEHFTVFLLPMRHSHPPYSAGPIPKGVRLNKRKFSKMVEFCVHLATLCSIVYLLSAYLSPPLLSFSPSTPRPTCCTSALLPLSEGAASALGGTRMRKRSRNAAAAAAHKLRTPEEMIVLVEFCIPNIDADFSFPFSLHIRELLLFF